MVGDIAEMSRICIVVVYVSKGKSGYHRLLGSYKGAENHLEEGPTVSTTSIMF